PRMAPVAGEPGDMDPGGGERRPQVEDPAQQGGTHRVGAGPGSASLPYVRVWPAFAGKAGVVECSPCPRRVCLARFRKLSQLRRAYAGCLLRRLRAEALRGIRPPLRASR